MSGLKIIPFIFVSIVAVLSCRQKPVVTGNQLDARFSIMDSVEVIYYDTADGYRYYTYYPTRDTQFVNSLRKEMKDNPERPSTECPKWGKIYCFSNGSIFNTLYFSRNNDTCNGLSFLHNGNMRKFQISDQFSEMLERSQSKAYRPQADTTLSVK